MRNPVSRGRKNNLDAALGYQAIVLHAGNRGVGKGCLVDWTIPIHARTLGVSVRTSPRDGHVLSGGETLQYEPICSLLVHLEPRFPNGGWVGGSSFFAVVLNAVTAPLRGGGPTISPWEIVVTLFSL